jgi:hypothetical protein
MPTPLNICQHHHVNAVQEAVHNACLGLCAPDLQTLQAFYSIVVSSWGLLSNHEPYGCDQLHKTRKIIMGRYGGHRFSVHGLDASVMHISRAWVRGTLTKETLRH